MGTLKLWKQAENQRLWFATVVYVCEEFDNAGVYLEELISGWHEKDGELDGRVLDRDSPDDADQLLVALTVQLELFEKWGLLSHELKPPRSGRYTESLGLRRFDVPFFRLTRKGQRVSQRSAHWQRLTFLRMVVWLETEKPRGYVLTAVKFFSPVFAFLNIVAKWDTNTAMIGGAIAAATALIVTSVQN